MKKKFLALVMTLSMVLSLVPMTALATGDSTTSVTQEGQSAGADANGSNQEGGSNADSDSTTTTEGGESTTTPEPSNNAAKIGDDEYPTVADAIDAIKEESSDNTITLLRDVEENITIGKSLTLDIDG